MKFVLALMVLAGVSAGGYYLWSKSPKRESFSHTSDRLRTATVEPRSIRFGVTAAGDIGPADQVSVRPEINGRIAGDLADEIDHFVKATLFDTPYVQHYREALDAIPVLDALAQSAQTGVPVEVVRERPEQ